MLVRRSVFVLDSIARYMYFSTGKRRFSNKELVPIIKNNDLIRKRLRDKPNKIISKPKDSNIHLHTADTNDNEIEPFTQNLFSFAYKNNFSYHASFVSVYLLTV